MGRKGARGKVPAWLVVVAFTQLALTLWFVRSIGAGPSAKQEEARPREVVEVVETTPAVTVAKEKPSSVAPLNDTTLDQFILFPKTKEIHESKVTPEFDQPVPQGQAVFFSIVIAAYNQGDLLQETVDSILKQTFRDWELVIVDDGSTDTTWDVSNQIVERNADRRIKILRKENGGLSDARNYGMRFAKGNWLCMLDSDDLLGKEYLSKAASLALQGADIVVGCMENFDAVSSVWCFPEGYSIVGLSHWNKFHASVLMSSRLVKSIGGYDQSLLWGLEDWNFWLSASRHRPRVMHLPEITFYYRHHHGSSMRKEMFRVALDESKAMVRTNHPDLFEPYQLLLDHDTIGAMRPESLDRLEKKTLKFPGLARPHFWKGLYYKHQQNYEGAIMELQTACKLLEGGGLPEEQVDWQPYYHLALTYEKIGNYAAAAGAIDKAFARGYFDEILACKYRLQRLLEGEGVESQGNAKVTSLPSYWDPVKVNRNPEVDKINQGTLAGRMRHLEDLRRRQDDVAGALSDAKSILRHAHELKCGDDSKRTRTNFVLNAHFEEGEGQSWLAFEKGFRVERAASHPEGMDGNSLVLENTGDGEKSGANQVVQLHQSEAAPILVSAWSRPEGVSGGEDDGYSLYVDITYSDGTNEWGFILRFNPLDRAWQRRHALLNRNRPIAQLNVYCMLRGHKGRAYFDDVVVAPFRKFGCACLPGEMYSPSHTRSCVPCPKNKVCSFGYPLAD